MLLLELNPDNETFRIFLRLNSREVKFKTKNYIRNKSSKVIFQNYALTVSLFKQIVDVDNRQIAVSVNKNQVVCEISISRPTECFARSALALLSAKSFCNYCNFISQNNLQCSEVIVEIVAENVFAPFNHEYFREWMRVSSSYEVLVYLPEIKKAPNHVSLGFINQVTHDIMVS